MDVVVVGRHTKVSDEFRERVEEKLRRIENIDHRVSRIDVHVSHERSPKMADERERVELTVHSKGPVVRAEATAVDRHTALDLAIDHLVERLRKQHERRTQRHRDKIGVGEFAAAIDWPIGEGGITNVEAWEGAPDTATREIPLDGTPITIRSKVHKASPMTVSDAIDQMELVGHDFYLFHDVESGLPSAVYRRRGWTYGVIHLERGAVASGSVGESAPKIQESA